MNLTEKIIQSLKPGEKREQYMDDVTRGFGLRVDASGRKSFFWFAKVKGAPLFRAIGEWPDMTLKDARDEAVRLSAVKADWKKAGWQGANPFEKPKAEGAGGHAPTFEELTNAYCDRHLKEVAKNPTRAVYDTKLMLNGRFNEWKNRRIDSLTVEDLLAVKTACGSKRVAANRCIQLCRRLLNWSSGRVDGKVNFWKVSENIAEQVSLYPEKGRDRFLGDKDPDEIRRFFTELEKETHRDLKDVLTMLIETGARRSDIFGMKFEDWKEERGMWIVPTPKNSKPYAIELMDAATKVLERRRRENPSGEFVFPGSGKSRHLCDLKRPWHVFRERAGLENFKLHDIRHSVASWAAINRVPLLQIGQMLGHQSLQSTARYSHLNPEATRAAREAGRQGMMAAMKRAKKRMDAPKKKVKLLTANV